MEKDDSGSDTLSDDWCNEYVQYEKRFERLLHLEFDASCGELEDLQAVDRGELDAAPKHTMVGQGKVDSRTFVVTFSRRPNFSLKDYDELVMSVTHPRRDRLVRCAGEWSSDAGVWKLQLSMAENDVSYFLGHRTRKKQ